MLLDIAVILAWCDADLHTTLLLPYRNAAGSCYTDASKQALTAAAAEQLWSVAELKDVCKDTTIIRPAASCYAPASTAGAGTVCRLSCAGRAVHSPHQSPCRKQQQQMQAVLLKVLNGAQQAL
jgi:hypothetical protein